MVSVGRFEERRDPSTAMSPQPARPALFDTLTELPRAGLEATRLLFSAASLRRSLPRGDGHPVLVLPAYAAGDLGLLPLRRFLESLGHAVFASELGLNIDRGELRIRRVEDAARFRRIQAERVLERVRDLHARTNQRVSLVGWSMGGLFAFDAARRAPALVRQSVTLGSPFGDPRETALWDVMRRLSGSTVPPEAQDFDAWLAPEATDSPHPPAPTTIVYSPRDGIVGRRAARIDRAAAARRGTAGLHAIRYRPIASSHLGFAVNPDAYREIAFALAATPADDHPR